MPRQIAVIGAGGHGRDFALRCLSAGYDVVLEDVLSSKLRRAEAELTERNPTFRGRLRLATSVEEAVRDADIVIDFVPDELESKLEIFSMVDRMAPPRTVLVTPTALSISDLASCTYRPERCFALAPFGAEPGDTIRLVSGNLASSENSAMVERWLTSMGFQVDIAADAVPDWLLRH